MSKIRDLVGRGNRQAGAVHGLGHIATLDRHRARIGTQLTVLLPLGLTVQVCERAEVPIDFQGVPPLSYRPEPVAHDGHAPIYGIDPFHAGNLHGGGIIETLHLAAKDRRPDEEFR